MDVFSHANPVQRVPQDHPLRPPRSLTDEALRELQPRFNKLVRQGWTTLDCAAEIVASATAARAVLVAQRTALDGIARLYLLFRWFVGLKMDDPIWDLTVFTTASVYSVGTIAEAFFQAVLQQAVERSLLSDEHFTMDRTQLEAEASLKSFQRRDGTFHGYAGPFGNATVDFHGEKQSNQTHESKSAPDAKLARKAKGKEAKLSYGGVPSGSRLTCLAGRMESTASYQQAPE